MDPDIKNKTDEEIKKKKDVLRELRGEFMVMQADYTELLQRLSDWSKKFYEAYSVLNNKLNGE